MNRQQVNSVAWTEMNVSSGFGDLYMGAFNDIMLIRKVPRQGKKIDKIKWARKWAREVELSRMHSDHETGPRVYYSSVEQGEEEIVMEKYTMDCFEYVSTYLDRLEHEAMRAGADEHKMQKVTLNSVIRKEMIHACEVLVDKLSTLYAQNPSMPFCFGDFRLENIVVKTEQKPEENLYERTFGQGHIVDMRQIDFDFCAAVQVCELTKEQYEAVLKMCLTMFRSSDIYNFWFGDGFMFADYLRVHFEELYIALSCVYAKADEDTLINLTRQTGLPWITSFEAVIAHIRKRLNIAVVQVHTIHPGMTTPRSMSSVTQSLLNHTPIRF